MPDSPSTAGPPPGGPDGSDPAELRIAAVAAAARFHGIDLDRTRLREEGVPPSPAALAAWLSEAGLWARAVKLSWRQLA